MSESWNERGGILSIFSWATLATREAWVKADQLTRAGEKTISAGKGSDPETLRERAAVKEVCGRIWRNS